MKTAERDDLVGRKWTVKEVHSVVYDKEDHTKGLLDVTFDVEGWPTYLRVPIKINLIELGKRSIPIEMPKAFWEDKLVERNDLPSYPDCPCHSDRGPNWEIHTIDRKRCWVVYCEQCGRLLTDLSIGWFGKGIKDLIMDIHGSDIRLPVEPTSSARAFLLQRLWSFWPDAVVQHHNDATERALHPIGVLLVAEISGWTWDGFFVYENRAAAESWRVMGYDEANKDQLIYVIPTKPEEATPTCGAGFWLTIDETEGSKTRKFVEDIQLAFQANLSLFPPLD